MKRVDNGQERAIPYCIAYKEDLQQIFDVMTVNGKPPTITSGEFEFADADELFSFLGETGKHELRIRCTNPYVTTTSRSDDVRVYTHDSSDASLALFHRISEVLERCRTRGPWRSTGLFGMGGALLVGAFTNLALQYRKGPAGLLFLVLGVAVLFGVLSLRSLRRPGNRFYGISRDSRKSFWQRKGDDLMVALIGGAIGAAIGAVLGVFGTLYTQSHSNDVPQQPVASTSKPKQ